MMQRKDRRCHVSRPWYREDVYQAAKQMKYDSKDITADSCAEDSKGEVCSPKSVMRAREENYARLHNTEFSLPDHD